MERAIVITDLQDKLIKELGAYIAHKLWKTYTGQRVINGLLFYDFLQEGKQMSVSALELCYETYPHKFVFKWNRDSRNTPIAPVFTLSAFNEYLLALYAYIKSTSKGFSVVLLDKSSDVI